MLILGGGQSTFNLGSHFATLLGLLLTMLILGAGGSINTQLGKSLCNFAGITSDNVDPRCQSTLNLGSHFATLLGLPLTMLMLGESIDNTTWEVQLCWGNSDNAGVTLNLGSHFATLLGLPLTMFIWGGSIDTQLGKSLCNFAGITSDNVYLGGVN